MVVIDDAQLPHWRQKTWPGPCDKVWGQQDRPAKKAATMAPRFPFYEPCQSDLLRPRMLKPDWAKIVRVCAQLRRLRPKLGGFDQIWARLEQICGGFGQTPGTPTKIRLVSIEVGVFSAKFEACRTVGRFRPMSD